MKKGISPMITSVRAPGGRNEGFGNCLTGTEVPGNWRVPSGRGTEAAPSGSERINFSARAVGLLPAIVRGRLAVARDWPMD